MPDRTNNPAAAASGSGSRNGAIKTFAVLAIILLLEGATIAVTMFLAGGPREVRGQGLGPDEQASGSRIVELLVIRDKFPNARTGRNLLYDSEIYITVRKRDEDQIRQGLETKKAQIKMEIDTIIRRADPAWFQEPTLATLRRQVKATLDEKLGKDSEDKPLVEDVLITKCIPFRTDL